MDGSPLISLSLLCAAAGVAVLALPLVKAWRLRRAAVRTIDAALSRQVAGQPAPAGAQPSAGGGATGGGAEAGTPGVAARQAPAQGAGAPMAAAGGTLRAAAGAAPAGKLGVQLGARFGDRFNERWLASRLGKAVVTQEEQQLLEQCGFYGVRARAVFGGLRLLVPAVLAAGALLWHLPGHTGKGLAWAFAVFAVGFLASKFVLRRRARTRVRMVEDELPILVDMLRLLQGVGLSIDQSLQVIVSEFGSMLRVLGPELQRANQQFASGRSREQTLLRIGRLFDSEDLKALITLLTQVDRHGGAVQEPLRLFGLRMQEARKSRMKDQIGRLTVKMTAVMVVSLLPVLLIITAGPGFLGVMRMLAQMGEK